MEAVENTSTFTLLLEETNTEPEMTMPFSLNADKQMRPMAHITLHLLRDEVIPEPFKTQSMSEETLPGDLSRYIMCSLLEFNWILH